MYLMAHIWFFVDTVATHVSASLNVISVISRPLQIAPFTTKLPEQNYLWSFLAKTHFEPKQKTCFIGLGSFCAFVVAKVKTIANFAETSLVLKALVYLNNLINNICTTAKSQLSNDSSAKPTPLTSPEIYNFNVT